MERINENIEMDKNDIIHYSLLENFIESILDNYKNPDYDINILCQKVGCSRTYMYESFQMQYGVNPAVFLENLRLGSLFF